MKKKNSIIRAIVVVIIFALSYVNAKSAVINHQYTLCKTDTLDPKVILATAADPVANIENSYKDETVVLEYIDGVLVKLTINGTNITEEKLTSVKENQEELEAIRQEREAVRREAAEVKKEAENVRRQIDDLLKLRDQIQKDKSCINCKKIE